MMEENKHVKTKKLKHKRKNDNVLKNIYQESHSSNKLQENMLSIGEALDIAEELVLHYQTLLVPHYNDFIVLRTMNLFAKVVYDEIELYFGEDKTLSSLSVANEYGVSKMTSDIFITFIQPLYESHFKHNLQWTEEDEQAYAAPKQRKEKSVSINTDANEVFLI